MDIAIFLNLAAVVTSAWAFAWGVDEYMFFVCWLKVDREKANALLAPYFTQWGPYGRIILAASFGTNIIVGIILCLAYSTPQAQKWHIAATLASLSHMAYAPKALPLLKKLKTGEPKGNVCATMQLWLKMHVTRMITSDLPAVLLYMIAAYRTL